MKTKDQKSTNFNITTSYKSFLIDLKEKVRNSQIKAALSVNSQLINMYWDLGENIVIQQEKYEWGSDFINQLSHDLSNEFPQMKGFSRSNLYYIKQWYLFYKNSFQKIQQLVGQIPWSHNILIIQKIKNVEQAIWYIKQTIENGWSRNVLSLQIKSKLYERQAAVTYSKVTNFANLLPKAQSDLAEDTLKDPYIFDFLSVGKDASEREIEKNLMENIRKFLLELGTGFAFIGNQYHVEVGGDDFYIDMLFYHVKLHCYVVVELKTTKFKPEYAGKLNFYLSVVDDLVKDKNDNPTIGLLLCQEKNKLVAEYSLRDLKKPMGISEYQLTQAIPEELTSKLPTVDIIEEKFQFNKIEDEKLEAVES